MKLGIILLIIILLLIFRDVILKILKSKTSIFKSKKIINKEYKLDNCSNKNVFIDVLDSDVKILYDDQIDEILIKITYLSEEYSYIVDYSDENISILRNNKENSTKAGHSGRILIKLPKKNIISNLDLKVLNGDVEFYDVDIDDLVINAENGIVKIDSFKGNNLKIIKENGDVCLSYLNAYNLELNIKNGNGDFSDVYGENINSHVLNGDFVFVNSTELDYKIKNLKSNTINGKQTLNVNAEIIG